jgi:Ulp1 family protease
VIHIIQKSCRGYLGRKRVLADRNQQKMELTFEYFDSIRQKMERDAGLILRYYLIKYCLKRRKKRLDKLAREEAAKNKKGKFGTRRSTSTVKPVAKPI